MKRIIYLLVILYGVTSSLKAQEVQKLEGEISLGTTIPLGGFHGGKPLMGASIGLEMRYNLPDPHFDLGIRMTRIATVYRFNKDSWGPLNPYREQSNCSDALFAFVDYNFHPLNTVNPFVGFGIGLSDNEAGNEITYDHNSSTGIVQLRGGVEVWQRLRVGGNVTLAERGFNSAGLTVCYVFGGRLKK